MDVMLLPFCVGLRVSEYYFIKFLEGMGGPRTWEQCSSRGMGVKNSQ